jgi:hypothetical protein
MKKVLLILMLGVFAFSLSSYNQIGNVHSNFDSMQVNCLDLADRVYDRMLLQEQYYIAFAAADAAYDSCVEEGGYAGDSEVLIISN